VGLKVNEGCEEVHQGLPAARVTRSLRRVWGNCTAAPHFVRPEWLLFVDMHDIILILIELTCIWRHKNGKFLAFRIE
jgi:hypothetical protein